MDREISQQDRNRRRLARIGLGVGSASTLGALFLFLPSLLRPTLERSSLRTAKVERGSVSASVNASGTVLPAFEQALSSPVEARVLRLLKHPGEAVKAGDAVLELDTQASRLELGRLADRLAQKRNEQELARLDLEASLSAFEGKLESARLDAEELSYRVEQNRKLRAEGLVSDEALKAAEVAAKKAEIEVRQTAAARETAKRSTAAKLEGLALDLATLEKDRDGARHELDLATARADRDGVVTWTVEQEGTTVRRGDVLARIAGLDSFRVEATVSDVHAARLKPGQAATVLLDGEELAGAVESVNPTIDNGAVRFRVRLDEPRHSKLRNNLRVDVWVATGTGGLGAEALRVRRGPSTDGGGERTVFVVTGNRAERRTARFGLAGRDAIEVLAGLAEGDEVVLSDLRDYDEARSLALR